MQWKVNSIDAVGHLLSDCHKGTSTFITGSQSARRYFVIIKMMQQASGRQLVLLVDVLGRYGMQAGACRRLQRPVSCLTQHLPSLPECSSSRGVPTTMQQAAV